MSEAKANPIHDDERAKSDQYLRTMKARALVAAIAISAVVAYAKFSDSREATDYKAKMKPLAEQLVKAQSVGDKASVLALAEPTIMIINDFNALDDIKKAAINQSSLRYCILAAVHLSSGPIEVLQTGSWASKSKYEAALDECK